MSRTNRSVWPGIILLVLGVLFLLDNLDVASSEQVVRTYWPVVLIISGLSLLTRCQRVRLNAKGHE
jgi:uncharacterized membrane protein HdeD (DUF308 family)